MSKCILINSRFAFKATCVALLIFLLYANKKLLEEALWRSDKNVTRLKTKNNNDTQTRAFDCRDKVPRYYRELRGDYWLLNNFAIGAKTFRCDSSITYTTHSDITYLDNLEPLLKRWMGPVSLSVYAPKTDAELALRTIAYYRRCSVLVKDYVTFHLFFNYENRAQLKKRSGILKRAFDDSDYSVDCTKYVLPKSGDLFKRKMNMTYPINVARNQARRQATTKYVFPSDIELYPSPGLIGDFLRMIRRGDPESLSPNPKVYVNAIFEIEKSVHRMPENKTELLKGLANGTVVPFHKYVCRNCHQIPKEKEWMKDPIEEEMKVFHVAKRKGAQHTWEPIFISNNEEPFYDERLTWEGRSDKMTQAYQLCMLDYEFHILNNAFLIHRPGIKKTVSKQNNKLIASQNHFIKSRVMKEIELFYGVNASCN